MANYTEIANKVINTIKSNLLAEKKKGNGNAFFTYLEIWDGKRGTLIYYTIKVDGKAVAEVATLYDMRKINEQIIKGLNDLKTTRGWGGLTYNTIDEYLDGYKSLYSTPTKVPHDIILLAPPCKEFKSLANYVAKYGNTTIREESIYAVSIGGKRGRVYGEEGDKRYLCHRPNKCKTLLDELRKIRGTNDKMTCSFAVKDDIDPWELQCSIRNETEFGGIRHKTLIVKCTTPSGKVKTLDIAI